MPDVPTLICQLVEAGFSVQAYPAPESRALRLVVAREDQESWGLHIDPAAPEPALLLNQALHDLARSAGVL